MLIESDSHWQISVDETLERLKRGPMNWTNEEWETNELDDVAIFIRGTFVYNGPKAISMESGEATTKDRISRHRFEIAGRKNQ